jgi:hypothetical protein
MKGRKRRELLKTAGEYGKQLQLLMRLDHWRVTIIDEPPPDCDNADVTWWEDKYRADMRLSDRFLRSAPEDQRYSLVHELLHLHLRGVALTSKGLRHHLSEAEFAWLDNRFEHEEELAVDALAELLAPFLPLPPEGE